MNSVKYINEYREKCSNIFTFLEGGDKMNLQTYKKVRIMLLQFRFKNYMSFKDEAILDMTATNIKEHQNTLFEINGNKILPVAAIYGANASGKSNIFKAFYAMSDAVSGNEIKRNNVISYVFDDKTRKEPSEFEVSILIDSKEYRYGFIKNRQVVFEEWLFEKKFSKNNVKEKCIYYRVNNKENNRIKSEANEKEKEEIYFISSMTSENELLITNIGKRNKSKYCNIYQWFTFTQQHMNFSDDHEENQTIRAVAKLLYSAQENDKDNYIFEDMLKLLKKFDEAIVGIKVDKDTDNDISEEYRIYTIHETKQGGKMKVSLDVESSGTKKLFSLASWLIISINLGGVLFVDELDAKLHPLVLRYIVLLFTDREINIGQGQIIFSAHNLICLNSSDLRRDEIWFVEKNNQESSIYSLYDFKEDENAIRSDLNFGKHYLSGRFGAIPFQD